MNDLAKNVILEALDIGFSAADCELAELMEIGALHATRFTSIERKIEAGFQELKAELRALKGTIEGELGSIKTCGPAGAHR